jgi:glycerol-3-phosphate O-acyltransferase
MFLLSNNISGALSGLFIRIFANRIQFNKDIFEKINNLKTKGKVVYVLEAVSFIDFVLLNYLFRKHNLPYPCWANDLVTSYKYHISSFKNIFRKNIKEKESNGENIKKILRANLSFIYFLRKPKTIFSLQKYLLSNIGMDLINIQKNMDEDIILQPIVLFYKKTPEHSEKDVLDTIFGETDAPGYLRKIINFFMWHKNIIIVPSSETISLKSLVLQNKNEEKYREAVILQRELYDLIEKEKKAVRGPKQINRRKTTGLILSDPELEEFIINYAKSENIPLEKLFKKAYKILDELMADYNERVIFWLGKFLNWLFNTLFDGIYVDKADLEKIRNSLKNSAVVIVPSHRSHFDYLVLSYLFYANHLNCPYIAAGNNMSFWPLGTIFRKGGAYFIRRKIAGDKFYSKILYAYLKYLTIHGYTNEIFIEGTRSRSGKQLFPKLGIISMLVNIYLKEFAKDIHFVPVSITYERIIEEKGFTSELAGSEKKKENFLEVLKASRILRKKFGKIYVQFNDPISIRDFNQIRSLPEHDISLNIALKISYDITEVATILPIQLVAIVLLTNEKRGIEFHEIKKRTIFLLKFLKKNKRVRFAFSIENIEHSIEESLKILINLNYVLSYHDEKYRIYRVRDKRRSALDFYKNNIIHFFAPSALISAIILNTRKNFKNSKDEIYKAFVFLSELFKYEFFYFYAGRMDEIFEKNLESLGELGLVKIGNNNLSLDYENIPNVQLLQNIMQNYIESYYASIITIKDEKDIFTNKDRIKLALKIAQRLYYYGDLDRIESVSRLVLDTALKRFEHEKETPSFDEYMRKSLHILRTVLRLEG